VSERVTELSFAVPRREAARVAALLFGSGAGAVEERDGPVLVVYVTSEEDAERLSHAVREAVPLARVSARELAPTWQTEWMRHLRPVALTERLVLQPTTDSTRLPKGKRRLWYEPDQAFGVGTHPTTLLVARATERWCRARRPRSVLDVGTGTGVLALVAARSGAARVRGVDVDPVAVRAARRNARLNDLGDRCSFSTAPLARIRSRFDLVLANIEVWVLLELAGDLCRVVGPGGALVLSGLLEERVDEVLRAVAEQALTEASRETADGWACLVLGRAGDRPTG
jgi:ribosomal protein L11 methyltransferase